MNDNFDHRMDSIPRPVDAVFNSSAVLFDILRFLFTF